MSARTLRLKRRFVVREDGVPVFTGSYIAAVEVFQDLQKRHADDRVSVEFYAEKESQ